MGGSPLRLRQDNYETALQLFSQIADSSKILTNIGLIYATLGEHEAAVEQFIAATQLDQYLAVAAASPAAAAFTHSSPGSLLRSVPIYSSHHRFQSRACIAHGRDTRHCCAAHVARAFSIFPPSRHPRRCKHRITRALRAPPVVSARRPHTSPRNTPPSPCIFSPRRASKRMLLACLLSGSVSQASVVFAINVPLHHLYRTHRELFVFHLTHTKNHRLTLATTLALLRISPRDQHNGVHLLPMRRVQLSPARYELAHKDFDDALLYLRGNDFINYEQLGLRFKLFAAEVLFNKGLANIYMGRPQDGMQDMEAARLAKATAEHNVIDDAIADRGDGYTVFSIPVGVLYRPAQKKIDNSKARDFLGKAKLVAAEDTNDLYTEFSGVARLKQGITPTGVYLDDGPGLSRAATLAATSPTPTNDASPSPGLQRAKTTINVPTDARERIRAATSPASPGAARSPGRPPLSAGAGGAGLSRSATSVGTGAGAGAGLAGPTRGLSIRKAGSPTAGGAPRMTEFYDDYLDSYADEVAPLPPPPPGRDRVANWAKGAVAAPPPPPSGVSRARSTAAPSAYSGGACGGGRRGAALCGRRRVVRRARSMADPRQGAFLSLVRAYVCGADARDGAAALRGRRARDGARARDAVRGVFGSGDGQVRGLARRLAMQFKDEDGGKVTLRDAMDYELAIETARESAKGRPEGRLEICRSGVSLKHNPPVVFVHISISYCLETKIVVQRLKEEMRLLNTRTKSLKEFDRMVPPYAILSHRWREEEVSLQAMQDLERAHRLEGFRKLEECCACALQDGYQYVWIDTCCIDKTSSAELSEAINSMYAWYKNAGVCYAYLDDVRSDQVPDTQSSSFRESRWFTRGWTLQELLAPRNVAFFAQDWVCIGTKHILVEVIEEITGIDRAVLAGLPAQVCVAQRMSWAAHRETTREEDRAYSLMGLFGVHMPTIYGEGSQAFIRLQYEIMKKTNDHSIFAWYAADPLRDSQSPTLLTASPLNFGIYHDISQTIVPIEFSHFAERFSIPDLDPDRSGTSNGIRMQLPLRHHEEHDEDVFLCALACTVRFEWRTDSRRSFLLVYLDPEDTGGFAAEHVYILQDCDLVSSLHHFVHDGLPMLRYEFSANWSTLRERGFIPEGPVYMPYGLPPLCGVILLRHEPSGKQFAVVLGVDRTQWHNHIVWSDVVVEDDGKIWSTPLEASGESLAHRIYEMYQHPDSVWYSSEAAASRQRGTHRVSKSFRPGFLLRLTITERRQRVQSAAVRVYDIDLAEMCSKAVESPAHKKQSGSVAVTVPKILTRPSAEVQTLWKVHNNMLASRRFRQRRFVH
ncbi:hypothetical protein A0H81_10584 [Grifola frondosa]|uniref:Uncharacterized protein n=1 Tax=Grifola frondosa TaxID=5627 RepID=A0A1C7LYX8_GRIFR|nr:hypothetical protein A0H81_10584 [Grifola frondosa]